MKEAIFLFFIFLFGYSVSDHMHHRTVMGLEKRVLQVEANGKAIKALCYYIHEEEDEPTRYAKR